jgi:hypothetical protein
LRATAGAGAALPLRATAAAGGARAGEGPMTPATPAGRVKDLPGPLPLGLATAGATPSGGASPSGGATPATAPTTPSSAALGCPSSARSHTNP